MNIIHVKKISLMLKKEERGFFKKNIVYDLDDVKKLEQINSYTETGILGHVTRKVAFRLKFKDGKKFVGICNTELFLDISKISFLDDF